VTSIASIKVRASSTFRTGVFPFLCVCLGPRTAWAGFTVRTWPTTIQSKSIRSAASRSDPGVRFHDHSVGLVKESQLELNL